MDRFGYVRRAMHGTRMLSRSETFEQYGRDQVDVDLRSDRWAFLNTLFSVSYAYHCLCSPWLPLRASWWAYPYLLWLDPPMAIFTGQVSEGCLYAQLVDRFDSDSWDSECQPPFNKDRCSNYAQLFRAVSRALFRAHVQSTLKSEVINEIERFVNFDPDMVEAMLQPLAQP